MSKSRNLVVTGATGKQGGALISALLAKPSQPFEIYAITRNPGSRAAQKLASSSNVHVVKGDFDAPEAIFAEIPNPWGLFSVTNPIKGAKVEEQQGKAMTKAALEAGVKHTVFTSAERGGQLKSDTNATPIPHFISKFNIEKDIQDQASTRKGVTWTFLRPVAFFENLSNDFLGKGFVSMWRLNGPDAKLQMIATTDIGRIAAEAFLKADTDEYRNKAISLAGDEISPDEAASIFQDVTGQSIPSTYGPVGRALRWALKEQLGIMFDWFKTDGFGVDLEALRRQHPFMKDFKTWLREESAWKTQ